MRYWPTMSNQYSPKSVPTVHFSCQSPCKVSEVVQYWLSTQTVCLLTCTLPMTKCKIWTVHSELWICLLESAHFPDQSAVVLLPFTNTSPPSVVHTNSVPKLSVCVRTLKINHSWEVPSYDAVCFLYINFERWCLRWAVMCSTAAVSTFLSHLKVLDVTSYQGNLDFVPLHIFFPFPLWCRTLAHFSAFTFYSVLHAALSHFFLAQKDSNSLCACSLSLMLVRPFVTVCTTVPTHSSP